MASPNEAPGGKMSVGWPGVTSEFSASFPIATSCKPVDNEDEWEYEYSATETETYYVTMDLSHSGMFEKVKDQFHNQTRGGYRQWFNPVYADPNKNTQLRPTKTNAVLFGDDKDDEDEVLPRDDDDDESEHEGRDTAVNGQADLEAHKNAQQQSDGENAIDPALRDKGEETPAASRGPSRAPSRAPSRPPSDMPPEDNEPKKPARIRNIGEIQVLDLHSDNPIISYKGRIFSGSWASNIGTELIFGAHDEVAERDLPHLQALPGGVDLMAASSVRILTTPADLRPKHHPEGGPALMLPYAHRRPAPDRYRAMRKEAKIEIPIAFDKHGRRKPQARFLENLMAIKVKKKELDEVTTITKDTARDYVDKDEDPEEASAQKKRARDRRRQKRLQAERAAKPKKRRLGGNGRRRNRVVSFVDNDKRQSSAEDTSSRLTPKTWGELGTGTPNGEIAATGASANGRDTNMQGA
ncbi:Vacuolar protein sorting-associated protein 62 [Gnomoniopsis smithogilvyi]|uniref:Vacuolar protein sorting-associated protein 62 n=1 Tax=Gnomoniopsis smithogilvyi TaxID=1191159 RepID=A0A9W8Z2F6_9PEZI|nr:Vacuolar protein sorting-associated protein 62 [Gnomoniopsis smithogilvyi]